MAISQNFPNVWPSLVLDFENSKTLDPRITFTRSSTATYVDSNGIIQTAAADEARFDHDPETGESLGLLIEESRSNLVDRSTATGATIGVFGSGGALPTGWVIDQGQPGTNLEIVNFGTEKGLNYIDLRFYGTTTTTNRWLVRPGSGFNITNGITYSVSCYAKLISGSTTGNYLNYVGASLLGVNSNSNLTRYTRTFTATSTGILYHRLDVGVNSIGTTYDLTIRFAAPQLEQGSFPTSYIPTSGSTVTRQRDNAQITGTNFTDFYNQSEGSFNAHFKGGQRYNLNNTTDQWSRVIGYRTGTNHTFLSSGNGGTNRYHVYNGSNQINQNSGPEHISEFAKASVGYGSDTVSLATKLGISTGTFITPTSANAIFIGNDGTYLYPLNGHIKQLCYYPERLTDTQLQNLTK